MFTGLVEETGTVVAVELTARSARLIVSAPLVHQDAHLGDSIAVNGCCLTVVAQDTDRLTFDAVPETLDRTNLGALTPGARSQSGTPACRWRKIGRAFRAGAY